PECRRENAIDFIMIGACKRDVLKVADCLADSHFGEGEVGSKALQYNPDSILLASQVPEGKGKQDKIDAYFKSEVERREKSCAKGATTRRLPCCQASCRDFNPHGYALGIGSGQMRHPGTPPKPPNKHSPAIPISSRL